MCLYQHPWQRELAIAFEVLSSYLDLSLHMA